MTQSLLCHYGVLRNARENASVLVETVPDQEADSIAFDLRDWANSELCARDDQTPDRTVDGHDLIRHGGATGITTSECHRAIIEDSRAAGFKIMVHTQSGGTQVLHRFADDGLDDITHDHRDATLPVLEEHQ